MGLIDPQVIGPAHLTLPGLTSTDILRNDQVELVKTFSGLVGMG